MSSIKKFIIADLIVFLVKVGGGVLCNSYTLLTSAGYDLSLILMSLFCIKNVKNTKVKAIVSSLFGLLLIMGSISLVFVSFITKILKPSLLLIIFILIGIIARYVVTALSVNNNYTKGEGLLTYSNLNSNVDFFNYIVIIVSLVLCKVSKWVDILKYADRLGTIIIASLIFIKGFKIIINSFSYVEDKVSDLDEKYLAEINNRNEIKKVTSIIYNNYGGIRFIRLNVNMKPNINMVDINTFMITLKDYLLKKAEIASVNLVKEVPVKKVKSNARNSRSGNSKTSTKKTAVKKKNKKR